MPTEVSLTKRGCRWDKVEVDRQVGGQVEIPVTRARLDATISPFRLDTPQTRSECKGELVARERECFVVLRVQRDTWSSMD